MINSVNTINPKVDTTVRVFDNFYRFNVEVDANEYDAVNSFFESFFTDKQIAQNFTTSLFRVAAETNTPVYDLLETLQGKTQLELTSTLCYYLNGLQSPATLLGINASVTPNFYTARNVVQ